MVKIDKSVATSLDYLSKYQSSTSKSDAGEYIWKITLIQITFPSVS